MAATERGVRALLLIIGMLNIIYGIGALDDANIFVNDTRFVLTNLNTLGWVLILLGIVQLTAGFSLFAGLGFARAGTVSPAPSPASWGLRRRR
jgi:hypothetical protein